jgi:hypothetical protein
MVCTRAEKSNVHATAAYQSDGFGLGNRRSAAEEPAFSITVPNAGSASIRTPPPAEQLRIERSLPHGRVAAVLGMMRKLGLHHLVPDKPNRLAKLALALIVAG